MARHDIAGGWVELRDPKQVSERLRRPVQAAAAVAAASLGQLQEGDTSSLSGDAIEQFSEFNDLLAVALVEKWSFGDTVSVDALLDLPGGAYDAIRSLVAPLVGDLMPSFDPTPDKDSPTEPSNA